MRVGAIGPKLDGHGAEDAELARHLMHPTQGPLLVRVGKLHHQAGGRPLGIPTLQSVKTTLISAMDRHTPHSVKTRTSMTPHAPTSTQDTTRTHAHTILSHDHTHYTRHTHYTTPDTYHTHTTQGLGGHILNNSNLSCVETVGIVDALWV